MASKMIERNNPGEFELEARLVAERTRLVGLCAHLTGNIDAAEDLAQETLVEAWRHRAKLNDPDGFSAWTSAIARNVCRRWIRGHGQQPVRTWNAVLDDVAGFLEEDRAAAGLEREFNLERDELADLVHRAMGLLAPEARSILIQRYMEDLSHAEIARRFGISEGATRVKLHRGKLAMKRVLTRDFPNEIQACGLVRPDTTVWQETRIWCPLCAKRRFMGRLDAVEKEFELRCPDCYPGTGVYARYTSSVLFGSVVRYKTALNRIGRFVVPFYEDALANHSVRCPNCERGHMSLHLFLPSQVQPGADKTRGLHVRCELCHSAMSMRLSNLALYQPRAWEFWRLHPRIHLLPERSVEVDGRPAVVLSWLSVQDTARLDVVVASDNYEMLGIHPTPVG